MGYSPAMLWVDTDGANTMRWSRTGLTTGQEDTWSMQEIAWGNQRHSIAAPALARHVDGVYAAWVGTDHFIYTSRLGESPLADQDSSVWSLPVRTGFRTNQRPALASYAGRLYLAWKDATEGTVHWAPAAGPAGWEIEVSTPWPTTYGPALGSSLFAGLFLAWRGASSDHQLHWTRFNSHNRWFDGPDQRFGGWTAAAPAMVGTIGHLYMAWRGDTTDRFDDPRLWWSRYEGGWADQQPLDGWSVTGPGLAADGQSVYLAYTEQTPSDGHGQIYWSHTTQDGGWAPHQPLGARKTYFTPAVA